MTNIVETHGLTKIYDKTIRAVDDLNVEIREGEIFGLLGPNGAGKTTTIHMLTTITRPTAGSAQVGGHDVIKEPRKVRAITGYSAQEAGVDEYSSGREYLTLFGHYYHLDRNTIQTRANELLELLELTDAADRLVATYSGGMRKRLEIGTALMHRPQLLVVDEPTLGLDIQTRVRIWEYLRRLNSDGMSILLTTHYLEETDKLCDRVAIVDHGRVVALGTPAELKGEIHGDVVSLTFPVDETEQYTQMTAKVRQALSGQDFVRDVQPAGEALNVYVDQGGVAVPQILRLLEANGVTVGEIALARPSLDDVFLKYTGRKIREEKGKAVGARAAWMRRPR
ncbi:MAG TPA: ATP-binding cassette domain-containing protein [Candidatus Bathyarchaeia archaeon]|nr:ATP-binding cassette domain-containing protein [Candidatus Bathyarchaeia archaeon]